MVIAALAALVVRLVGTDRRAVRSAASTEGRPGGASLPIVEKSIAVLPFENLSAEKQNEYFTDGVQDEILTDLAKSPI